MVFCLKTQELESGYLDLKPSDMTDLGEVI